MKTILKITLFFVFPSSFLYGGEFTVTGSSPTGEIRMTAGTLTNGDIGAVNAGTNLTGGGTSGEVTLNLDDPITLSSSTITELFMTTATFSTLDCTANSSSGTLTVDSNGQIICADDNLGVTASAGSSSEIQFHSTVTAGAFDSDSDFNYDPNNNFVGLGTAAASAPIHIVQDQDEMIRLVRQGVANVGPVIQFYSGSAGSEANVGSIGYSDTQGFFINGGNDVSNIILLDDTNGNVEIPGGSLEVSAGIASQHFDITGSTTISADENYLYLVDSSVSNSSFTLYNIGVSGFGEGTDSFIKICKVDNTTNTVEIAAQTWQSDTIDSVTLTYENECVEYNADGGTYSDGTGHWQIVDRTSVSTFSVSVPISAASLAATITDGFQNGVQTGETTTNSINYDFISLSSTTDNFFQFSYSPQQGWDEGDVQFQMVWTSTGGTVSSTTVFGMQALCIGNGDNIDTAYGSEVTVSDVLISTGDVHITDLSSNLTPGGSCTEGDYMVWKGQRDWDNASDDLDQNVQLMEIRLRYFRDRISD